MRSGLLIVKGHPMKKLKSGLIALLFIQLLGCATFQDMESGLNHMMNRPIETAFQVLGYPSSKQDFGSATVYYWHYSSSGTLIVPQSSHTYGNVGSTSFYSQTTYNQAVPVNYSCQIKISTNQGIMNSWEYSGNLDGCRGYIERLKSYRNQAQQPVMMSDPQNNSIQSLINQYGE